MKIVVKNLSKEFKKIKVLKEANLELESGKIYGLNGRNGSGKSVFLKLLCGFYVPTTGTIEFDGVNYTKLNQYPKDLRALIERPSFLPDLSGYANLKLLASIQDIVGEEEIINTLKLVNLIDEKDKKFSKYSLGMKQKLGIAQVLMENPNIIILDEPFNGIDIQSVEKIKKELLRLKKEGKLIIISSHIKEDLESLTDQVYLFDDGNVSLYE